MNKHDYLIPGVVALVVAVLFPVYWLSEFAVVASSGERRLDFGLLDVLFLIVGVGQFVVYLGLKVILQDHHAYRRTDLILTLMMGATVVSYLFLFIVGTVPAWNTDKLVEGGLLVSLIVFGALDLVLGIFLWSDKDKLADGFKYFALVNAIMGLCELTVFLSITALILYPVSLILLAVIFLKKPQEVEFV
ncbi:MAG: hypothetical protein NXH95_14910 [Pseudomonadaceae bacterium]|nr:hypothetical protein [Pseudomonadaceae bacterium]